MSSNKPVPARSRRVAFLAPLALILVACSGAGAPTVAPSTSASPASTNPGASPATSATPTFAAQPGAVTLVAYSTPREAYEELIPAFQATDAGAGTTFEQTYAGSGDQSRAVQAGLPADVLALALWPDIERLVEPGIVADDWDENDYDGIIHDSIVVFDVRPGNPKNIHSWEDLLREDVQVITPNPITSGGAQWNILAAYQAQIEAGKSEEEAIDFLRQLAQRVVVWDPSARDALNTFLQAGQGDVLIGYENEAIFAQQQGQALEYVVPASTLLIENAIATTTVGDAPDEAAAFVEWLYTPEAQTIFGNHGFRPVVPDVLAQFPDFQTPANLATVNGDLGGWGEARPKFFDPEDGIMAQIFSELGIAN
ncbi:MAG: sulfate/thiosulfate transport system substrate-binding protein [Chloroflexota bacterium]|nr:sulfate/thiosulfate transport system substrate-binding protein [Chloroflexota bacterium]